MRNKAKNLTFNQKVMRLMVQVLDKKILPIDAVMEIVKLHDEELAVEKGRI